MTHKPMDVERTLLELETKWRERTIGLSEAMTLTPDALLNQCADELKAVREALREPGARPTFREWFRNSKHYDDRVWDVHAMNFAADAYNAALAGAAPPANQESVSMREWLKAQRVTLDERQLFAVESYLVMNVLPAAPPVEGKQGEANRWQCEQCANVNYLGDRTCQNCGCQRADAPATGKGRQGLCRRPEGQRMTSTPPSKGSVPSEKARGWLENHFPVGNLGFWNWRDVDSLADLLTRYAAEERRELLNAEIAWLSADWPSVPKSGVVEDWVLWAFGLDQYHRAHIAGLQCELDLADGLAG